MVLGRLTHYAFDAVLRKNISLSSSTVAYVDPTFISVRIPSRREAVYRLDVCPAHASIILFPAHTCFVGCSSLRMHQKHARHEESWLTRPLSRDPRPSFKDDKISESKELKKWVDSYFSVGEWVMDQSIAVLGSSGWFERKR
ncbi:MAG: hypothetical protein Q9163_002147 [Psora crenata]